MASDDYGMVVSIFIYCSMLSIIFSYGLSVTNQKILYFDETNFKKKSGNIFAFQYINFIVLAILVLLIQDFLNKIFFSNNANIEILLIAPLFVLSANIKTIPLEYYRSKNKAIEYVILYIIFIMAEPMFIIYYSFNGELQLADIIAIKYLSLLAIISIYSTVTLNIVSVNIDIKDIIKSIKIGLPNVPAVLSKWIVKLSNRIILNHYYGLSAVGIYAANMKIENIGTILITSINNTLLPVLIKNAKNEIGAEIIKIPILIFSIFCMGMVIWGKEFIIILSKPEYYQSKIILFLVGQIIYLNFVQHLIWPRVLANEKIKKYAIIKTSTSIVNILLNIILIKYYGIIGAAIATTITYLIITYLTYQLLRYNDIIIYIIKGYVSILLSSIILIYQSDDTVISISEIQLKILYFLLASYLMTIFFNIKASKLVKTIIRK
jgi:O-antigen/teichoic acid export membrane protein